MNPHYQRGQVLLNLGRFVEAEREFAAALDGSSADADVHRQRASCFNMLGRYQDGKTAAEEALRIASDDWRNHYALAFSLVHLRDKPNGAGAADHALKETLRMAPENADTWALLAVLRWYQNRPVEMLEAARNGLHHDPQHFDCLIKEAEALLKIGDIAKAEAVTRDILRLYPESPWGHSLLGRVHLMAGRNEEAEASFLEALRMNPMDSSAHEGFKRSKQPWAQHEVVEDAARSATQSATNVSRPTHVEDFTVLMQDLGCERQSAGRWLLLKCLRLWLRLPHCLRLKARDEIRSFIRFCNLLQVIIASALLLGALLLLPSLKLTPEGRVLFCLAGASFWGLMMSAGADALLTLARWMQRRADEIKWQLFGSSMW
jgi:tetratricopeptide (TPR) repeat protein